MPSPGYYSRTKQRRRYSAAISAESSPVHRIFHLRTAECPTARHLSRRPNARNPLASGPRRPSVRHTSEDGRQGSLRRMLRFTVSAHPTAHSLPAILQRSGHRHRVSVPPTIRPASIFKTTFRPDRARPVGPSHLRISTRFTIARTFHLIKAFRTSNSGAHPVYDVLHPLKAVFYPDRTRPESPIYGGPPAPDRPYLPLTRMRPNTEYTNLTPEPIIRAASIQGQRLGRIGSAAHCLYFPRCRPPRQAHGCIIRFRRSKDSEAENLRSDFTIRTIAHIRPTMLQSEHRTEAGTGFAERPTRTVVGQQPARSSTS